MDEKMPDSNQTFDVGSVVYYGMHGKCRVAAIEKKQVGDSVQLFYKLDFQTDTTPNRAKKKESAIFLPLTTAQKQGLRAPIVKTVVDSVFELLSSREFYFPLDEEWGKVHASLDLAVRTEGTIGLAKAYSYLVVLKKRNKTLNSEAGKYFETVERILFRELSDATGESIKSLNERALKAMKPKFQPSH